jgi:hypothetical protein
MLFMILLTANHCALGQTSTAITGHVTDQTGARVPKATVTLHNELTNQDTNTVATSTGDFTFTALQPGLYDVSATAPIFDTARETGIHLELEATVTVNLTLKPGTAKETVTVRADEIQLDQTHADRGEVYSADELENAPLNGGNPMLIANTEPGVIFTGNNASYSTTWVRPFDNGAIQQFSTNGQGSDSNDFQLDGSPNNSDGNGSRNIGYVPPTASIQEMKFVSNPYDAQYGHTGGGIFDIVLKSGTNTLHGQVYENARRTWLDANTHYNDVQHNTKGSDNRNQYGFQADGPVVVPHLFNGRNKTFFEAQFENYHQKEPLSGADSVPPWSPGSTTQTVVDTGDFSDYYYYGGSSTGNLPITLYDPQLPNSDANVTRQEFGSLSGNRAGTYIPPTRFNATSKLVLGYYPKPNQSCAAAQSYCTNNYRWQGTGSDAFKNVVARLDHTFGASDRGYLRYAWNKRFQNYGDPGEWNGISGGGESGVFPLIRENHFFTAYYQHTFSANSIVELHLSYTRYLEAQKQGLTPFDLSKIGLNSLAISGTPSTFPRFVTGGLTSIGNNGPNGGNTQTISNTIAGMPLWTYVGGKHTFKAGLDYRWMQASSYTGDDSSGYFDVYGGWTRAQAFNTTDSQNNTTGLGLASFLLGYMDGGNFDVNANSYYSYPYFAPFAQDDWKLTNKLTINLGLRWDFQGGPSEHHNKINSTTLDTTSLNPVMSEITSALPNEVALVGGLQFAGVNGQPRTIFAMNKFLVQPRIGFAYLLDHKTVIRGGFGTTYLQYPGRGFNYGFSQSTTYVGSTDSGAHQNGNPINNPFPTISMPVQSSYGLMTELGDSPNVGNYQYKIPSAINYSLGFERQLNAHTTIDVSYVGTIGTKQGTSDNINRTNLGYRENCNIEMGATVATYNNCNNQPSDSTAASNSEWVANPFRNVDGFSTDRTGNSNGYYSNKYLQKMQFTRPMPQFGDITQYDLNGGRTQYDSLQIVATHRWSNELTAHGNFVWSKTMDSGGYADTDYRILNHHIDTGTYKWRFATNAAWHLPVGQGRKFLGNSNRLVDSAVGGWTMGVVYYYQAGNPVSISGFEQVHKQTGGPKREFWNGYNLIQGTSHCWGYYDTSSSAAVAANEPILTKESWASCPKSNPTARSDFDYILRPSWAETQNISDTGIRNPRAQQLDISLSKTVPIYDRLKVEVRLDGYNIPNHPSWGNHGYYINTWSENDPDTGSISMTWDQQTNIPRNVQLSAKIIW